MTHFRVALMAKAPVPGLAKTRLVPALGEAGAAALAQRLLSHALLQAHRCASGRVLPTPARAFPDSQGLSPVKARVALMLALMR